VPIYSLTDLNLHIKETLEETYPEALWIKAEIASFQVNSFSGHCYLELSDDQGKSAKARAMIWKKNFDLLHQKFKVQTGQVLGKGLQVLVLAKVEFSIQYGLSLVIWDLDASFTLGQMAIQRQEVIRLLERENRMGKNKTLNIPMLCQRIAVVSSPTAAGWEDFRKHLEINSLGYAFRLELFSAQMQGKEAIPSIQVAFQEIEKRRSDFDLVVMIRGGGSQHDLQVFDAYETALCISESPLPVWTGIGHERDETVCDLVAHTAFKTPTAVANQLLDRFAEIEAQIMEIIYDLQQNALWKTIQVEQEISGLLGKIKHSGLQRLNKREADLEHLRNQILRKMEKNLFGKEGQLSRIETELSVTNPLQMLRKGYARLWQDGVWKKSKASIGPTGSLVLQLHDGNLRLPSPEKI
jgi:exodeoxyribonuclease VII large subunit